MNQKDFKNKSEMQIFLSYFKPHRKLFLLDMVCALAIAGCILCLYYAVSIYLYHYLLGTHLWSKDRDGFST